MEEKKFGIDLIKKSIKFVYDTTIEGVEALKDKKLSLGEILGFGDNAYTGVTIALKSKEQWAQITDIDTSERNEIVVYVGELVKDVTSDEVDIIIDNAIQIIQKEIQIYETNVLPIIAIIKK